MLWTQIILYNTFEHMINLKKKLDITVFVFFICYPYAAISEVWEVVLEVQPIIF